MTVHFCDVSAFQPGIDWTAYATSQDGVVIKATQGTRYVSEEFESQRAGATRAGLWVGLYHFAQDGDPVAQAQHFCRTVGSLKPREFAVLDIEHHEEYFTLGLDDWPDFIARWCGEVATALNTVPLVYMSESPAKGMSAECARWPLWVAGYVGTEPTEWEDWRVGPWSSPVAWQWTSSVGRVPGWGGKIDRNIAPDDFLARIGLADKDDAPRLPDPPGRSLEGVHPFLADRVRRLHARHPTSVNSGWRSSEDQQLFWDCAEARRTTGNCPPGCERSACASANRPGQSNHEAEPFGTAGSLAVDAEPLDGNWDGWHAAAVEEGMHTPIDKEPWHLQPTEVTETYFVGFPEGWWPPPSSHDQGGFLVALTDDEQRELRDGVRQALQLSNYVVAMMEEIKGAFRTDQAESKYFYDPKTGQLARFVASQGTVTKPG